MLMDVLCLDCSLGDKTHTCDKITQTENTQISTSETGET